MDVYRILSMTEKQNKFTKRLIVAIFIVPVSIFFIAIGNLPFALFWTAVLVLAAWEYWRLFKKGGYSPSLFILLLGVAGLTNCRYYFEFNYSGLVLSITILLTMTVFVFSFDRGSKTSAIDFGITLGGVLYLGWLGSYFISLRMIENGKWWLLVVLPAVWFTDLGGYFIGGWFGKRKLSKIVSPNKTIEGYFGGIAFSTIFTYLISLLWNLGGAELNSIQMLIIGLVIGIISPIGDLGESMLKRQFEVKDTSKILPGHGGILDRIDTWLWAAALGYYLIVIFF